MRIRRFVVGLAAVLALSQMAFAQAGARARMGRGGIPAVKTFLELSDAQVQQLTDLRKEEAQALVPIRDRIKEKAQALAEARKAGDPNPTAIGQLTLELQRLREQVRSVNKDYHEKALALLDASQKEKLGTLEQVTRRATTSRQAAAAATALNLMLSVRPPAPPTGMTP